MKRSLTKRCLITGANGFLGGELVPYLEQKSCNIIKLLRRSPEAENERQWDPAFGRLDSGVFEGVDTVIHLAGENIAEGRWNAAKKELIRSSRVNSTKLLVDKMAQAKNPPKTFLCASAVGIYGDRGLEVLNESSTAGSGFLPEVGRAWEQSAKQAESFGMRVVQMRFGMILHPKGGALGKMLPIFKMAGGGVLGDGKQYISWISMRDLLSAIEFLINQDGASGAYNLVAPNPVDNQEFTKTLGQILNRPTPIRMPAMALKLMFGDMAQEVLLASTRVLPSRLIESGFKFQDQTLEEALQNIL